MKLACSSTAFDEQLRRGDLTQLEWIDACARELAVDGAVFDVRHFPRADTDYLAQIKKMCTDLGLTVAALRHDGFFCSDPERIEQTIETALALGAPIISAPLEPVTTVSWPQSLQTLNDATALAKRFNVTLALRNTPHSHAASVHDMKRAAKEADSAWLRFGPDLDTLEAGDDPRDLMPKTVLVWHQYDRAASVSALRAYRGFVVLDALQGDATMPTMQNALAGWRAHFVSTA